MLSNSALKGFLIKSLAREEKKNGHEWKFCPPRNSEHGMLWFIISMTQFIWKVTKLNIRVSGLYVLATVTTSV